MSILPYTYRKGTSSGHHHIDEEKAHEICKLLQDKPEVSATVIARMLKVSPNITSNIVKGQSWTHISHLYDFTARHTFNLKWGTIRGIGRIKKIPCNEK